jgi:hypothetical protein
MDVRASPKCFLPIFLSNKVIFVAVLIVIPHADFQQLGSPLVERDHTWPVEALDSIEETSDTDLVVEGSFWVWPHEADILL